VHTHQQLFVGGRWTAPASDEVIEVVSPATEQLVGRVPLATAPDLDRAVAAARTAFDAGPWPRTDPAERAAAVARLGAEIKSRADAFADLLSTEVGTPRSISPFLHVGMARGVFDAYARFAADYPWTETRSGARGSVVRVRRAPVGVVAAIVPWNVPLFIAALKLAPALVAGATVVLKPPVETPLHAFLLAEAVLAAGLPEGVVSIVPAGAEGGERLVRNPQVDKVSFTGSTAVGRRIGELCGQDVRRCTLELGGKSAAVLLDDVALTPGVVKQLVAGAMGNSGQVCAAQTRLLVPRSRYRETVDALAAAVGALRVGDPFDPASELGPLVTARQRDRVEHYLAVGRKEGARLVVGGGRPAGLDRGWYVEPTLFADVDPATVIAREEIFGPVMTVTPYGAEEEAVALANDSAYGLAGAVWTADPEHGAHVAARIRTGTVAVNSAAPLELAGPFGGFKQSGIGRESGPEGIDDCTELQTIVLPRG
jgi:aldehyde dehydrogenase (NAD+)